jgi:hypothetical protein
MANTMNVSKKYPGFNDHNKRAHFANPVSFNVNTDPDRYELVEMFDKLVTVSASVLVSTNLNFEILGTNVSADDVTYSSVTSGLKAETDGGANDQVIFLPCLTATSNAWTGTKWGTENQVIWEAVLRTGSAITATVLWAGLKLTNTSVIATDNDQAMFRYSTTDSNTTWRCVYSIGGTDVNKDSGVAVAADTNYYFRIEIDADRKAHFFIDDKEVASSTALTNDVDLIPYVGIEGLGAAKHFYIMKEKISRILFE